MLGCLLFVCSCGLCTAALTLPLGAESVRAVTLEEDVALKDSYAVGEILAVPKGILSVGEQTYEATSHVLYYPSSKNNGCGYGGFNGSGYLYVGIPRYGKRGKR